MNLIWLLWKAIRKCRKVFVPKIEACNQWLRKCCFKSFASMSAPEVYVCIEAKWKRISKCLERFVSSFQGAYHNVYLKDTSSSSHCTVKKCHVVLWKNIFTRWGFIYFTSPHLLDWHLQQGAPRTRGFCDPKNITYTKKCWKCSK